MKYSKVHYRLRDREFDSDITLSEPDRKYPEYEGTKVKINWSSHGELDIEDAQIFADALLKAIETAKELQSAGK